MPPLTASSRSLGPRRRRLRRAASVVSLVAVLLTGTQAVAQAAPSLRPDPNSDSGGGPLGTAAAGYQLAMAELADGRTVNLRWNPCLVIDYRINADGLPAGQRAQFVSDVRRAVESLARTSGLHYRYLGRTTHVPRSTDKKAPAELVIAATDPAHTDYPIGDRMVGYGGYQYWQWRGSSGLSTAAIVRGWVVLDSATFSRLAPGFGVGVRQGNVLLHELAHTVGLEHVDDVRQLMNPELTAAAQDGWAAGDRRGLDLLGPDGGGCIR